MLNVLKLFPEIKIKNKKIDEIDFIYDIGMEKLISKLQEIGYDGMIVGHHYVVFDKKQLISAV